MPPTCPGPGFAAGPCLFKDTMQLAAFTSDHFPLGQAAMQVNEGLPAYVVSSMERRYGGLQGKTVGILGMAFKGESDDTRASLSYKLRKLLSWAGARVLATDPYVDDDRLVPLERVVDESDVLVLGAPHKAYRGLEVGGKDVVDVWGAMGRASACDDDLAADPRLLFGRGRLGSHSGTRWLRPPSAIGRMGPPHASDPPAVIAVPAALRIVRYILAPADIGFDARLYVAAAGAWLHGADPWAVTANGIPFAAPPPTLIVLAPFTVLPGWLIVPAFVLGRSRWPFSRFGPSGCRSGSSASRRSSRASSRETRTWRSWPHSSWQAAGSTRWRPFSRSTRSCRWWSTADGGRWAMFAAVLVVTAPVLPWGTVGSRPPEKHRWRSSRSAATTSVSGNVPLMLIGGLALLSMGVRRAGWLAVPLLWPWTQPHYLAMSMPALTPLLLVIWTLPLVPPQLMLASIVVAAIGARFFPAPESDDGETGRVGAPSAWGGWRTASWPRASRP